MKYLIHFEEEEALDSQIVGQKFYALAKAVRRGFAVPPAVAISTAAHRYYLANRCWPKELLADVLNEAVKLDLSRGLSIRSSAIQEDLEKQSFAGQYRSFLKIVNPKDLKHKIEECWSSIASETVRSYLQAGNLPGYSAERLLMAVVIQKMVAARTAGIAFGRNPMKPARQEIVIEAVNGLAEGLVSGHRTPYRAVVDKDGMVKLTPPTSKNRPTAAADPMLRSDPFWRDIAQLVRDLESDNGEYPLDIEWAADNQRKIWLLQARRITTIDNATSRIPAGIWTRKIANDLWADRLTPFLAHHMLNNAPRFDLSRALKILGIPLIRPTLAVIHGYLYINGKSIQKGISFIPPKLRLPELDSLLPPSMATDRLPGPSIGTLLTVIFRSALLPITEPGVNPLVSLWRAKYDLSAIGRQIDRTSALSENSPRQTMEKLHKALETLCLLQIKNQWPYFFATLTTWILRWLAMNYRGLSHADFLNLLSKDAKNISIDIEHSIRSMARKIVQNKALADHFIKARAADLAEDMPPAVRTDFNNFIARYGCRSRHRTLLIKRWSESPEEIIGILQTLVRNQLKRVDGLSDSLLSAPLSGDASIKGFEDAEKPMKRCGKVARSSGSGLAFSRLSMHLIAQLNRRFLDLREELRFALDRILSMIRQTMLTLGKQTGLGDKVMFLNADELKAVVTGELSNRDARRRAFDRFNAFMQPFDAATFWNEGLAENEFQTGGRLIRGIGTSPGRVTGRAKIVDDPTRADIQKGDILIAKNTDPGWTPVLSIVGGVVTEEGGLLNHCAIVARELRVPSIVGVEGAARQIQDGDRITIDGGLGVIIIED